MGVPFTSFSIHFCILKRVHNLKRYMTLVRCLTKRYQVQFPVRAHPQVAGSISGRSPRGVWEATDQCLSLSLPPSLPMSLKWISLDEDFFLKEKQKKCVFSVTKFPLMRSCHLLSALPFVDDYTPTEGTPGAEGWTGHCYWGAEDRGAHRSRAPSVSMQTFFSFSLTV